MSNTEEPKITDKTIAKLMAFVKEREQQTPKPSK